MTTSSIPAASALVDSLLGRTAPHTPELVRSVRDCELLHDPERHRLTAYAWVLQSNMPTRDPKTLLSRFIAYAEAESDAWDMDGQAFEAKHGFPPKQLAEIRELLLLAATETVRRMDDYG